MDKLTKKQKLGATELSVPPIVFGTSCLGNLYQELPYETKLEIASEWFRYVEPPVVLDSAGKYGAGLALEVIGQTLGELGIGADEVIISNKLGWKRIEMLGDKPTFEADVWVGIDHDAEPAMNYEGILECYEQGCGLLGGVYTPQVVSVHDPDEYLAAAADEKERSVRLADVVGGYKALGELKSAGKVKAVGVGSKDWTIIRELFDLVELDWVMFACSLTVYTHPAELLSFMKKLCDKNVAIINSAVFNGGFLTGGEYFDYKLPDPHKEAGLFTWRERFFAVCAEHGVKPAIACVQFGMSVPGVVSVALNTSRPQRIRDNVESVAAEVPGEFWKALKTEGLVDEGYPYI